MSQGTIFATIFKELTFWRVFFTLVLLFLIRIIWKYISLWFYLQSLKKKGAVVLFQFPAGLPARWISDTKKKGDVQAWIKEQIQKDPEIRLLATHFGTNASLYFIDPELIKAFLSDQSVYEKSAVFDIFAPLLGKGLLFGPNSIWKKHRRIISEAFRFEFIASQLPSVFELTERILNKNIEAAQGKHIDLLALFQQITGQVVFQIFFGSEIDNMQINGVSPIVFLVELSRTLAESARSPENVLFGAKLFQLGLTKKSRRVLEQSETFRKFGMGIIEARKKKFTQGAPRKDLLGVLLENQASSAGADDKLTDEEILHEFFTFFIAGMDTTAVMLTFLSYFLYHQDEKIKEQISKQLEGIYAAKKDPNLAEIINKAEMVTALFRESVRVGPPATFVFPRSAKTDHFIEDVFIKKGTNLSCSFIANNYNPQYYKNPSNFNIFRWIQGHPDYEGNVMKNSFIYTPFSAGPRNCIGQHFSLLEGKIILSVLLNKYRYKIPDDYKMQFRFSLIHQPKETLFADIEERTA